MDRRCLAIGAGLGFAAVVAGTFGAHGLDQRLSSEMLEVFETGVRYHMYHALAIVASGWVGVSGGSTRLTAVAAGLFVGGIVFFSGSLYALAISDARWLGMVAPVGGVSFLGGWAALLWAGLKRGSGPA